jgi:hypothetical protein
MEAAHVLPYELSLQVQASSSNTFGPSEVGVTLTTSFAVPDAAHPDESHFTDAEVSEARLVTVKNVEPWALLV